MAGTDSVFHGKLMTCWDSTTQINGFVDYDIGEVGNEVDGTAGGDTSKTYLAGISDSSISLTFRLIPGDSGQTGITIGAELTLEIYPNGKTAGEAKYTGTVVVTSINRNGSFEGVPALRVGCRNSLTQGVAS